MIIAIFTRPGAHELGEQYYELLPPTMRTGKSLSSTPTTEISLSSSCSEWAYCHHLDANIEKQMHY